jgi:hypothetical protein
MLKRLLYDASWYEPLILTIIPRGINLDPHSIACASRLDRELSPEA